jgi:hypothetical protein
MCAQRNIQRHLLSTRCSMWKWYVELVERQSQSLTEPRRSTDITNEPSTPQTPSQSNHMSGIVMMKVFSTMDSRKTGRSLRLHIGKGLLLPRIHSFHLGSWEHVNSLK